MIKRVKYLNFGIDKNTKNKLEKSLEDIRNKSSPNIEIHYDIVFDKFYITY
ncbi:hypothetical protein ACSW8L_16190 (plasmid) [Clostridium perfringens]